MELTTRIPASIAKGSSVAQYLPSRYSSTKTGTFAPTLTLRTRSLRTTLPANTEVVFWSSIDMTAPLQRDGVLDFLQRRQFRPGGRVQQDDGHRLLVRLLGQHQ